MQDSVKTEGNSVPEILINIKIYYNLSLYTISTSMAKKKTNQGYMDTNVLVHNTEVIFCTLHTKSGLV